MPMTKVGARVVAIECSTDKEVRIYGYGTYVGDEVPHERAVGMAIDLREMNIPNPKIQLDNGKDVFGCECHWGPVDRLMTRFAGLEQISVDIDAAREKYRQEEAEKITEQAG